MIRDRALHRLSLHYSLMTHRSSLLVSVPFVTSRRSLSPFPLAHQPQERCTRLAPTPVPHRSRIGLPHRCHTAATPHNHSTRHSSSSPGHGAKWPPVTALVRLALEVLRLNPVHGQQRRHRAAHQQRLAMREVPRVLNRVASNVNTERKVCSCQPHSCTFTRRERRALCKWRLSCFAPPPPPPPPP